MWARDLHVKQQMEADIATLPADGRTTAREGCRYRPRASPPKIAPPPRTNTAHPKPPTLNEPKSDAVRPGPVQVPVPNLLGN